MAHLHAPALVGYTRGASSKGAASSGRSQAAAAEGLEFASRLAELSPNAIATALAQEINAVVGQIFLRWHQVKHAHMNLHTMRFELY